jgi:hypothetical protein
MSGRLSKQSVKNTLSMSAGCDKLVEAIIPVAREWKAITILTDVTVP